MNQAGRVAMMRGVRLPYKKRVEYLESTGTQYIDTGFPLSSDCRAVANWTPMGVSSGTSAYAFGAYSNNMNFGVNVAVQFGDEYVVWKNESTSTNASGGLTNVRHTIDLSSSGAYRNGTLVYTPSGTFTSNKNAYLFWANGTGQGKAIARIYFVQFYSNGVLVRDFIPVRFTNENGVSEGAMYDRANPTVGMNPDGSARTDGLYRNRGTGAFLYGNDI